MKKLAITLFLVMFLSVGCGYKSAIIFNDEPFSRENFNQVKTGFRAGERIYYLFVSPYKFKTPYIRVQVASVTDKTYQNFYKPFWSGDYKLMKDEVYYYTNYVVIHSKGKYLMQVFPIDRLEKPLAFAFFVVN